TGARRLVRGGERRRRAHPAIHRRWRQPVEDRTTRRGAQRRAHDRTDEVGEAQRRTDRGRPPSRAHGSIRIAAIGAGANRCGPTTARTPGRTHSQITLIARRFAPGSTLPGGANARPLPFGSSPIGTRSWSAPCATASGVIAPAAGSTMWNRAQADENPARAAALISS